MSSSTADVSNALVFQSSIASMFKNVLDANNQPVNPLLISQECIRVYSHQQLDTQHYAFMGVSILQLAVSSYLRNRFSHCKDMTLFQLQRILLQNQKLQKVIAEMFMLKSEIATVSTIVETILGITNDFYGVTIVFAFIANVLDDKGPILFQTLPRNLRNALGLDNYGTISPTTAVPATVPSINTRPIIPLPTALNGAYHFDCLLKKLGGQELKEFVHIENPKSWACKVVYQLKENSIWRSHTRTCQNKKKARNLACQDILDFYKRQPGQMEHDKAEHPGALPEKAVPLPIHPSEYCNLSPLKPPTPLSPTPSHNQWYYSLDNGSIHFSANKRSHSAVDNGDEDKILMEVLLGNMEQLGTTDRPVTPEEMNGSGKRFRADPVKLDQSLPISPAQSVIGSREPRTDVEIIRSKLDIVKLEQILVDPVRNQSPKSCLLPLVHTKDGLEIKSTFQQSGRPHELVFEANVTLSFGQHSVSASAKGSRKNESEQNAIRALIRTLTNI